MPGVGIVAVSCTVLDEIRSRRSQMRSPHFGPFVVLVEKDGRRGGCRGSSAGSAFRGRGFEGSAAASPPIHSSTTIPPLPAPTRLTVDFFISDDSRRAGMVRKQHFNGSISYNQPPPHVSRFPRHSSSREHILEPSTRQRTPDFPARHLGQERGLSSTRPPVNPPPPARNSPRHPRRKTPTPASSPCWH
jgi:hypothetical protein